MVLSETRAATARVGQQQPLVCVVDDDTAMLRALRLLIALGIVNGLIMIATFSLTPYLPRYVLPSCVINAAAIAILFGGTISIGRPPLPASFRRT